MNIALLKRRAEIEKESAVITINAFAEELKKRHNVFIVSGRTRKEYKTEFKKIKEPIDIIHGFSAAPLVALNLIAAKRTQPHAKTIFTLKSYSRHPLGSLWFTPILNAINAVTVPTHVFANKLKSHGLKKNKIHIIHSSLDTEKFVQKNKSELKEKYNYKKKKIVLYYGSLFISKGVDYLINASKEIENAHPNALILIAPREGTNDQLIQQTQHKSNIKIIPEINVVDYVNLADCVVLPYTDLVATEGNPSCMLEAIACKTPVITTDMPEIQELFNETEIVIVPRKNAQALAEAINNLLSNEKKRKELTENAYKKIKQFDIHKVTKDFEEQYKQLIQA